jgi:hypothetical protein
MAESKGEQRGLFQTIKQLVKDELGAAQQAGQEWRKLQMQQVANMQVAMDESMKLMRMTLDYQMKLGQEWREFMTDLVKPFMPSKNS